MIWSSELYKAEEEAKGTEGQAADADASKDESGDAAESAETKDEVVDAEYTEVNDKK